MTKAEARDLILRVFVDRSEVTVPMLRAIRGVQRNREQPESEALFDAAEIPYPGVDVVMRSPESIRLIVMAAAAAETMEELWATGRE